MRLRTIIWVVSALVIVFLLLSRQSKVPATIDGISSGFRKLWNPLTGASK